MKFNSISGNVTDLLVQDYVSKPYLCLKIILCQEY